MTNRRDLASVIDDCLDDLVAGRRTVSDCLARYPEHRAALEPLLRAAAAVQALPRHAERAPDRIRRAALMEQIRETPQESPRCWLPRVSLGALLPRLVAVAAPIAAAALIGVVLLTAQPATPAAASTLTVFSGGVEEQVGGAWQPLADGAVLGDGRRLRTNAEGHALLTFPDGSTSSLDPATEILIERLWAGTQRSVRIRQYSGRLWNDVLTDNRAGARYEVSTEDAVVQVHGAVFETAVDGGQISVATAEGTVEVIVGNDRVSVPRGETVRAVGRRVADRSAAADAGSLTIDAPFAGALLSERSGATGARPDGAIFRQIRGVTTSNPGDGPQRFDFQRLEPGTYTLMLQRFEAGSGDIVLAVGGTERRVPIDRADGTAQVRLRVESQDGKQRVVIDEDRPGAAAPAERAPGRPDVRVVETDRTKKMPDLAAQRAALAAPGVPGAPAGPTGTRTPAQGQTATPLEAFAARLREAILRNDAAAIRLALQEVAGGTDANNAQVQLRVLVALLNTGEAATRVAAALGTDTPLRARLLERAGALPVDQQERLRRTLQEGSAQR